MRSRAARMGVTIASSVPVLGLYSLVNGAVPSEYDLAFSLDHAIPLLPWTFPLYMSIYVFLLVAAALVDADDFKQGMVALLLTSAISFGIFMLIPAAYPQPDPNTIEAPWGAAFRWLHSVDGAQNTFPSLHVGCTACIAWMLRHHRLKVFWFLWAAGISLTTLTTKQHFVVDVFGGLGIAVLANAAARRILAEPTSVAPGQTS